MSRYTIQLRSVIDLCGEDEVKSWFSDYELSDYLTSEEIAVINERGTWSKEKLAQMIIDHYYMYEIGLETPGLFKHQAKVMMRELMEEKAPLIYSAALKYDPLANVDLTETYDGRSDNQSNANSTSQSNGSSLSVSSDTPQGQINKASILQGKYASSTEASENENRLNNQTNTEGSGNEHYERRKVGISGSTQQKMVELYRKNIIMINRDIIKDVGILFMSVY